MSRLYVSVKSDRFGVACNGEWLLPCRFNSRHAAEIEATRRNRLAALGLLPSGVYGACSITQRPEARPFKLNVTGNGF